MATVIGVRFRNAGKLYYFDPGQLWPAAGDAVIVETVRGVEYGEVVTGVCQIADELITPPLKKVIRVATAEDAQHEQENRAKEHDALVLCQKKANEHKLQMKLVNCEYTFDNNKILFYFVSDKRVDFRALVKDLAGIFRTRIELRQIGVRDEAKMMGGLGQCGRPICCASFLGDFQPVSIKMAKEQNLSLNPTKISGVCGRLMCCLKYEEDYYEATRKRMPKAGKEVVTPDGRGVVVDLNVLKETVRVRIPKGDAFEQKDYPLADVQRIMPAQRTPRPQAAAAVDAPVENAPANEPTADETSADDILSDDVTVSAEMMHELEEEDGLSPVDAQAEVAELTAPEETALTEDAAVLEAALETDEAAGHTVSAEGSAVEGTDTATASTVDASTAAPSDSIPSAEAAPSAAKADGSENTQS